MLAGHHLARRGIGSRPAPIAGAFLATAGGLVWPHHTRGS
jgi:hypothetical protein